MSIIDDKTVLRNLSRKMAPPLVTLLSAEPEIQYVALRNINLIVQRAPQILAHEIKVFFCKYNDPIYVKMEKLEIMIKLVSEKNIEQVLLEFKEYAQEVDVDFVRKSVRAIGRCALKLERAAERCINKLLDLIHTKVNYVVQEAIIVRVLLFLFVCFFFSMPSFLYSFFFFPTWTFVLFCAVCLCAYFAFESKRLLTFFLYYIVIYFFTLLFFIFSPPSPGH